jgi:hypothetical protein
MVLMMVQDKKQPQHLKQPQQPQQPQQQLHQHQSTALCCNGGGL